MMKEKTPRRTFDNNGNNKHTSSNTIHMAQLGCHLPDSFVHVKNFTNLNNNPHGTTRISEDDDDSERSFL